MSQTNEARSRALAFASRNYPVLPLWGIEDAQCACGNSQCRSPGKHPHPLAPHGRDNAVTNVATVESWFDEAPNLNYGLCTDTLPTIDIDPRNGGDRAWLKLIRENYDVHTWRVVTGGGGRHIIFGADSDAPPLPCGKLARGVDVKGAGGYIVGVGSLHVSGKRYHWAPQCRPKEAELKAVPLWVRDKLKKPKWDGKPRAPQYYRDLIAPALEGERNDRITKLFGHLYGSMFPDRVVLCGLVVAWNRLYCEPPLDDREVIAIARNIAGCENKKRGDV